MLDDKPWLLFLIYGLLVSVLFPIIYGLAKWKNLFLGLKVFVIAQIIYLIILLISMWLSFGGKDASKWSYFSALNDCLAYCSVYYLLINNSKTKTLIKIFVGFVCLYLVSDFILKFQESTNYKLYSLTIETIFINTLTLLFIVRLMFTLPFKSLLDNPIFWFGIAKIIPALYSLGLELFQDFLISDNIDLYFKFYGGDLALHIFGNLLYTYSLWLSLRFDFGLFRKI